MRLGLYLAALAGIGTAVPACACSFSWNPGWSPKEIKKRADVRRLVGRFYIEQAEGQVDDDGRLITGTIEGRVESKGGTRWQTTQDYDEVLVECLAYVKPTGDAEGVFWIARQKKNGRYDMLLWGGQYLPKRKAEEQPTPEEAGAQ